MPAGGGGGDAGLHGQHGGRQGPAICQSEQDPSAGGFAEHPAGTVRSRETEACLRALDDADPKAISACEGWTTHEVVAHLAATAAEVTRHLEPYLRCDAVPATQSFAVREAPYRALSDEALRRRLEVEEEKMRLVIDEVLAKDPRAVIPWTGRQMAVAKFVPHLRNEFAIHRWDIAGDDETSTLLLSQPELTEHAVGVLGQILLRRGADRDPDPGEELHVRLRSPSARDVRVSVRADWAGLELADDDADEPTVELDAATRTLFIWGRRSVHRGRGRSHLPPPMLARLQAILAGYCAKPSSLELVMRVLDSSRRHDNLRALANVPARRSTGASFGKIEPEGRRRHPRSVQPVTSRSPGQIVPLP